MTSESAWPRLEADGVIWEARVLPGSGGSEPSQEEGVEVVEFICVGGGRKPRQLSVPAGKLRELDEEALARIYRQARPIGGDHYGRPGKRPSDAH